MNPPWIRRCCYLDDDAKQCRAYKDLTLVRYHGDRETNYAAASWVVIALCPEHFKPYLKRDGKTK